MSASRYCMTCGPRGLGPAAPLLWSIGEASHDPWHPRPAAIAVPGRQRRDALLRPGARCPAGTGPARRCYQALLGLLQRALGRVVGVLLLDKLQLGILGRPFV